MQIDVLCVGSVKEKYYLQAIQEYSKRLSRYIKLNIYEVKDEKTPDQASEKENLLIKKAESTRLEKHIVRDAHLIALAIEGRELTSEELSEKICNLEIQSHSHIQFIIGGSLGIDEELKRKADDRISFSRMTFPHQLMRVILLEQLYRAYKIKHHEPYHK